MAQTAQDIIAAAMSDRSTYDAMAKRESDVWGAILPTREKSQAAVEDAAAAASLRVTRHVKSLAAILRGVQLDRGLTLGCGAGRLEQSLIGAGVCRSFHGIDISADAVRAAEQHASEHDLPLTYETADLNFLELPNGQFDLVVAQTSLHHVLRLEHVAEQVHASLRPGGYFWVHDFIGETQGQHSEARMEIVNRILAILPEEYRRNALTGRTMRELTRPAPGRLVSPFEKIRSGEIVTVLEQWFDVEVRNEFNSIAHYLIPPGTRASFAADPQSRAIAELVMLIDDLCIKHAILEPLGGQYLMRPKIAPRSATRAGASEGARG